MKRITRRKKEEGRKKHYSLKVILLNLFKVLQFVGRPKGKIWESWNPKDV